MYKQAIFAFSVSLFVLSANGGNEFNIMDIPNMLNPFRSDASKHENDISKTDGFWPVNMKGPGCNCANFTCSCCVGVNINFLKVNQSMCTNLIYDPQEFSLQLTFIVNDQKLFSNMISGKNPPPMCLPFFPFGNFCIHLFGIRMHRYHLHACVRFDAKLNSDPILGVEFDCMRMGLDGVSWLKPTGNSYIQNSQNANKISDSPDHPKSGSKDKSENESRKKSKVQSSNGSKDHSENDADPEDAIIPLINPVNIHIGPTQQ